MVESVGRTWTLVDRTEAALNIVASERANQDALKAAGKFRYTCADAEMSDDLRYVVLGEEIGEVARAALHRLGHGGGHDREGLREALLLELSQVAAVAVAWMEALLDEARMTNSTERRDP